MKHFFYLLCGIFLIAGCADQQRVPKSVVQPERMQSVMWDVFLAEAWAKRLANQDSTVVLSDVTKELTLAALKTHQLDEKTFFKSYQWYVNHPQVFQPLLDSLYEQQAEIDNPALPEDLPENLPENLHKRSKGTKDIRRLKLPRGETLD